MSTQRVRDGRPAAEGAPSTAPTGPGHAWAWFLGAAFAGGLLSFILPEGSVARGAVFAAAGVSIAVAIFMLVRSRSGDRDRRVVELEGVRERLRRAEERYRTLVEHVPAVVYEAEPGEFGRWVYLSPQIERILGFSAEEWMADPTLWSRHIHPEDRPRVMQDEWSDWSSQAAGTGGWSAIEYRLIRGDGEEVWVRDEAFVVRDDEGRPVIWRGLLHDITDTKRANEKLRRTERMLADAQRVGRLGSWDWNAETGVTEWSDELYRLYGVEPGGFEPTLDAWLERLHPDDRHRIRGENEQVVARGGPMEMEFRVVLPSGQVRDHRAEGEVTHDDQGRPLRMIGVEYDVTDLKRAQADLNQTIHALRETDAQRRRLLGRVVEVQEEERSRIAADFHDDTIQVMTAVGMRLEALRNRLQGEDDRARVQSLEQGVTRAVARLRNLLFELRPRALDREGLVAALRVYLSHGGRHEGVSYEVDNELLEEPPVETRVVLFRAAQEALANARKHAGASRVLIELRQSNDGYLVRITDDGRGFTPATEGEPGHLGIVAMQDRVVTAGGWLRIDSTEEKGTTVEFWVPGPQALQAGASA